MEKLPTEIEENILSRLTMEAALPAKQVCKTWRIFLRSKTDNVGLLFAESYKDKKRIKLYYGDEYDPVRIKVNYDYSYYRLKNIPGHSSMNNILGSCNGLVCFAPRFLKTFLICNPFNGEAVYVPKHESMRPNWSSGFGYCQSTNDYKIVSVQCEYNKSEVLVYTLGGGGGWRSKGSNHIHPVYAEAAGTYANGALHWMQKDITIVAFDLEDEKFQYIPLPRFKDKPFLKLLGGNNLYLVSTSRDEPYCMDVWAYRRENTNATNGCTGLKEKYNDMNSWNWIKQFSIELDSGDRWFLEPLAITRNDELLMYYGCDSLYCYDLKTSTKKDPFDGDDTGCSMINVIPHANTIVSIPKDLAEAKDLQ